MEGTSVSQITTVFTERVRGDLDDGIVFTEQAVELGTVFQAKILEYDDKWGGTTVSGVQYQCSLFLIAIFLVQPLISAQPQNGLCVCSPVHTIPLSTPSI